MTYTVDADINGPVLSQREVADRLGITQASVQETEQRAMQKFKAAMIRRGYEENHDNGEISNTNSVSAVSARQKL